MICTCISIFLIFTGAFILGGLSVYQRRFEWYHDGYVQGNKDSWEECAELWVSRTTDKEQSK